MQTLKTDIRQRILSAAHREFIKNGVRQTSIRALAIQAGVAVGNVYHYFRTHNDEEFLSLDVFDLRQQQINHIMAMLTLVKQFRPELRLLLFNAEGTSLANYKDKIIDHQMQVGVEYLRLMKERYPHLDINMSPFFLHLTCSAWLTLFCELVEHEEYSEEEIRLALQQYVTYGMAGWKELMKP